MEKRPPQYNYSAPLEDNFDEFFEWSLSLERPFEQLPKIGEELGFGVRLHPLGFIAVYLSEQSRGSETPEITGIARANIYPPGVSIKEDKHTHGFSSRAGVREGLLIHNIHYPERVASAPDDEVYLEYRTTVDKLGRNHTSLVNEDGVVIIPRTDTYIFEPGQTYSLEPTDCHSVSPGKHGTVTIFCKTPAKPGKAGQSMILKRPDQPPPPRVY